MRQIVVCYRFRSSQLTTTEIMCDITNQNFNEKYDEILKDISKSDFIAIDCEFSGLTRHSDNKQSLFDNPSESYVKIRRGNEDFIAFQIGITSFTYNRDEKYEASTYTFHIFPRLYSTPDAYFLCDARCIQFLSEQNFNFNKVFRNGITYIRSSDESTVRKEIEDGTLMSRMRHELSREEREAMRFLCNQVMDWCVLAEHGDSMVLDTTGIEPFTVYLIREEIESMFPMVFTHRPRRGSLRVELTEGKGVWQRDLGDEAFALVSGFTRLLKEVISMKKPLVGHNLFSDLLVLYKMFIAPLPEDYDTFKREITRLFPEVYDTKYLSTLVKKMIRKKDLWSLNALPQLYTYFEEGKGSTTVSDMPVIEYRSFCETPRCKDHHDSGFDSYCTGYVFLKLAHMFSMWDPDQNKFKKFSLGNGPVRCFGALKDKRNRIYFMRSYLDHVCLDGPDPATIKPDFILMESLTGTIDINKVSNMISKFDAADIKPLTGRKALIAPTNKVSSKMIRKQFIKDRNFRLTIYKPDSHSTAGLSRGAFALVFFGGIGIATFLWYKNVRARDLWEPSGRVAG